MSKEHGEHICGMRQSPNILKRDGSKTFAEKSVTRPQILASLQYFILRPGAEVHVISQL